MLAVSKFRVCILWRTRSLWSSEASPSETLLTASAVVKWDGLAFGAFPSCVTRCFTLTSRFLPPRPVKVTIYAARCRHFLFLLFSCTQRILGYVRPRRIVVLRPPTTGKRRSIWRSLQIGTAFHTAQWRNWPSNAPLKDADTALEFLPWQMLFTIFMMCTWTHHDVSEAT